MLPSYHVNVLQTQPSTHCSDVEFYWVKILWDCYAGEIKLMSDLVK